MTLRVPILDLSRSSPAEIGAACAEYGFFLVRDHGVSEGLQARLERHAETFFRLPDAVKSEIAMAKAGRAWRGFFPVGAELTSGRPDLKEGVYFGSELGSGDPRVLAKLPMHGANLFPEIPGFRETVLEYMDALESLGQKIVSLIAESLGLPREYFWEHYTRDPITLFRVFHYPPVSAANESEFPWGVGEHTDYGLLTLLKQDDCGGLEVKTADGAWVPVPPIPNTFVCNIGDMLDMLTRGRYRSAPHRVRNLSGRSRYSYPFFFDPGFSTRVEPLPVTAVPRPVRWDAANLDLFRGTYGEYLLGKVAKVFPGLAESEIGETR